MIQNSVLRFLWAAALSLLVATSVTAQTRYAFTHIADDAGPLKAIGISPVALNDAGQVTFIADFKTGHRGIFTGSGGPLTTIADTSARFQTLGFNEQGGLKFGFPSINGQGLVAFGALTTDHHLGFFAGTGGSTTLADNTLPIFGFSGDIYFSGSGSLATFEANVVIRGRLRQALVVGSGGPLTTIVDTSGPFANLDLDPRINGSGQVAFHGIRRDGSEGIFLGNGGPLTTVADNSGSFAAFSDAPAINDTGDVLFQATLRPANGDPEIDGLYLSSGGTITTVAQDTGEFSSFGYAPALNTKGQIAFLGTTQSGLVGIFTGADPEEDRVIAVGDDLDGSTVSDLSALSFRTALNNKGQIAFIAALKNGRTGVYRADPKRRHRQGDPDGDRRH